MEAWIFMLIVNLIIPFSMIGFGQRFLKNPPKEINKTYGYRTKMSMKNKNTWNFAHKYCGKIWYRSGVFLFSLTLLLMIYIAGNLELVWTVGTIIIAIELIVLVGSIIPTERALKKEFDSDGNRR